MYRLIVILLCCAVFSGCAPWLGIDKVEPGMTKAEVIGHMGKPSSASGSGEEEYLWYVPANRFWERYYIHLVSGKVKAYGPLGGQAESPQ